MTVRLRHVVGCMTGTSIDAIDVALVALEDEGLRLRARVVAAQSRPLDELAPRLRDVAEQRSTTAGEIARLSHDLALKHLEAVRAVAGNRRLEKHRLDLVCVHGQTVYHLPPVSWQLFQPAPLAHGLGVPVVYDLRAADLAKGGQGAPITPLADWVLFRAAGERRAIVNLGGYCNITRLADADDAASPVYAVSGADVCACNQLLDGLARALIDRPFDDGGRHASAGRPLPELVDPIIIRLGEQAAAKRSLGTGDELSRWILVLATGHRPEDVLRSACVAIARTIADAVIGHRVILAGGGVRNDCLVEELRTICNGIATTDDLGVPAQFREAVCFAVLGALCQDRVAITLPAITGLKGAAPISGHWVLP